MRKSRLAASGAVAVGAVALSLLAPPAASASIGASVAGSEAYYYSSTNVLQSKDTAKDGVSSVAQLSSGGVISTVISSGGSGTKRRGFVIDPAKTVYLRACKVNQSRSSDFYGCSAWQATNG